MNRKAIDEQKTLSKTAISWPMYIKSHTMSWLKPQLFSDVYPHCAHIYNYKKIVDNKPCGLSGKCFGLPYKLKYLPQKTQRKTYFKQCTQTLPYIMALFPPGVKMFSFLYFFVSAKYRGKWCINCCMYACQFLFRSGIQLNFQIFNSFI